jgi:hypothetical protein
MAYHIRRKPTSQPLGDRNGKLEDLFCGLVWWLYRPIVSSDNTAKVIISINQQGHRLFIFLSQYVNMFPKQAVRLMVIMNSFAGR